MEVLPHLRRAGLAPDPAVVAVRDDPLGSGVLGLPGPGGRTFWVVTRYDDVRAVLGDPHRFSSAAFAPGDTANGPVGPRPGAMLNTDPPEHERLRRMVSGQFTVKRVRWLEPRIRDAVQECLADMAAAGPPTDLVTAFALPVPSRVIGELLGVPARHREAFAARLLRQTDPGTPPPDRERLGAESRAYLAELVHDVRATPGEDVLGMLVREHGDELSDLELVNFADLLLFAGHETTANTLALAVVTLLGHPDQAAQLRDEASVTATAVDELLRYLAVLQQTIPRTATENVTIGGHDVAAGDVIMVALPAASRDPRRFDDPDTLDVTRPRAPHLAFGYGIHFCLGAALARAELAVALPALLTRFPRLALATDHVDYRPPGVFFGVTHLPVTW